MGAILRKYGVGTGAGIHIPIIKAGVVDFAVGGDWTPAAGDVKVSKDGGAQANIGTLPVYTNGAWKFVFSDAELTCAFLAVMVVDSAPKAVEDQAILIETYGNASAQHAFDLDSATVDLGKWRGTQPNALVSNRVDARVGAMASGVLTAAAVAADAITAAKIAAGAVGASELATDALEAIADKVLERPISNVEPGAGWQTMYGLVASVVDKHERIGADIRIYKTDGVTVLKVLSGVEDAAQVPVKSLTP